jgi:hypothetical protein
MNNSISLVDDPSKFD